MSELEISEVDRQAEIRRSRGNRYKPIHKLAMKALVDSGHTPYEVAKLNGVSHQTVYRAIEDPRFRVLESKEVDSIKRSITGKTYETALRAELAIDQEKLDKSSALQLMTIAAIGIEKGRLMENLSTENVAHASVMQTIDNDVKALQERKRKLLET